MIALIPPFRFSVVEHNVYRGAYPTLKNFAFLRRSIISVTPETPTTDLLEFCHHEGIASYYLQCDKVTDHVTLDPTIVSQVLSILVNIENEPVYIHCLDGANVTGLIIMVLRRLQNWNLSAITAEFCRFTHDHTIEKEESQFVTNYTEDIIMPPKVPRWLWQGVRIVKHPTLRLRHDPPLNAENDGVSNASISTGGMFGSEHPGETGKIRSFVQRVELDVRSEERFEGVEGEEVAETGVSRMISALDLHGIDSLKTVKQTTLLLGDRLT